ncbi:MAG: hypothetical protein JNK12_01225 [Acidimicrobiales bacterium]|nr:hypothetical protein [Acidimicrobiales bacterium]
MAELAEALEALGFDTFKEARHRIGLNQRQAAGKFTNAEIDELLARLEEHGVDGDPAGAGPGAGTDAQARATRRVATPKATSAAAAPDRRQRARDEELVVRLDADLMATELVNRGWCCIPPE